MKAISDRYQTFPLCIGMAMGHLGAPDTIEYLTKREVTKKEINDAYIALLVIAKAFYREEK